MSAAASRKQERAAWVFRYLADASIGSSPASVAATTIYDNDAEFVWAYGDAFPTTPGTQRDADYERARQRVSRLLSELARDGWLHRGRLGNFERYHPRNEPTWLYQYSHHPDYLAKIKSGRWTPESMAQSWGG